MIARIDEIRKTGNSIGGVVEVVARNVPAGLGSLYLVIHTYINTNTNTNTNYHHQHYHKISPSLIPYHLPQPLPPSPSPPPNLILFTPHHITTIPLYHNPLFLSIPPSLIPYTPLPFHAIGSPVFDKLEAELAKACMSLPASKGFEIGSGFRGTLLAGYDHNDAFYIDADGRTRTKTNRSGGVQGGISNGENIVVRVAFKPTSTIGQEQDTVTREGDLPHSLHISS